MHEISQAAYEKSPNFIRTKDRHRLTYRIFTIKVPGILLENFF